MGCCIGDCGILGLIKDAIVDTFCFWDNDCGYHPGPSENEVHAKKIADELAAMKEKVREAALTMETSLSDNINKSMDELIELLVQVNRQKIGGQSLNINIEELKKANDNLKNKVKGCIGDVYDERLVLTDKELGLILEERDDKKRGGNFDAFCKRIRVEALNNLEDVIEETVDKQYKLIAKEINLRLKEVESRMKEVQQAYNDVLKARKEENKELETLQIQYMYKCELFNILIDEIND